MYTSFNSSIYFGFYLGNTSIRCVAHKIFYFLLSYKKYFFPYCLSKYSFKIFKKGYLKRDQRFSLDSSTKKIKSKTRGNESTYKNNLDPKHLTEK